MEMEACDVQPHSFRDQKNFPISSGWGKLLLVNDVVKLIMWNVIYCSVPVVMFHCCQQMIRFLPVHALFVKDYISRLITVLNVLILHIFIKKYTVCSVQVISLLPLSVKIIHNELTKNVTRNQYFLLCVKHEKTCDQRCYNVKFVKRFEY